MTAAKESTLVVLTAVSTGRDRLLVVPLVLAVRELTATRALSRAATFGQARADPLAAEMVAGQLPTYRRWLLWDGELEPAESESWVPDDDEPFGALEFFGEDGYAAWVPDPLVSTARWCQQHLPDLWARQSEDDTGWGFDHEPVRGLPPHVRDEVEEQLVALGFVVRHHEGLHDHYLSPDTALEPTSLLEGPAL